MGRSVQEEEGFSASEPCDGMKGGGSLEQRNPQCFEKSPPEGQMRGTGTSNETVVRRP